MKKSVVGLGAVPIVGLLAAFLVYTRAEHELQGAWNLEQARHEQRVGKEAASIARNLRSVYENIRTIAFLPSVRNIDRHAENLSSDARLSVQQIYNNLVNSVDVSEVYILPANFNPERIDPVTGKFEEPAIMFDQFVVDGGKLAAAEDPFSIRAAEQADRSIMPNLPEIEIDEYRQMAGQLNWFKQYYPDMSSFRGLDTPMISGTEIITCDNSEYQHSLLNNDRKGAIFSVPVYDQSGKLHALISAVIRTNAVRNMIAEGTQQLSAPLNEFAVGNGGIAGKAVQSFVPALLGNSSTAYVKYAADISSPDPRGKWVLNSPIDIQAFLSGPDVKTIRKNTFLLLLGLAAATAAVMLWLNGMRKRESELRHEASHDKLTGVPNRKVLDVLLDKAIGLAERGTKSAVLYIDLDGFKSVNDTLGHQIGDGVIKAVTDKIKNCIRGGDCLARIGGDEFVVLQHNVSETYQIMTLAKRIIGAISVPFEIEGRPIHIGASIGVAMVEGDETEARALLRRADLALYRVKNSEKGNFKFYSPEMDAEREKRILLEADLRQALANHEFFLQYQPIVDALTGDISGAEALVRWRNGVRGIVPPGDFIPLAEETGLINQIGQWVLERACADAIRFPQGMKLGINVSPVQFRNPSFGLQVANALAKSGLPPKQLEVEITESVLLSKEIIVHETLQQLKTMGIRLALDDFGTGYSSLSYLRKYDFDKVKIDRSFIAGTHTKRDAEIFRAIASLSRTLGMVTTVEGVETEEQLKRVQATGCNEVQGFFFGRPMNLDDLLAKAHSSVDSGVVATVTG